MRWAKTSCRWIDGLQNVADILTKLGADKVYFRSCLCDACFTLQQDEERKNIKEKKQAQRAARKVKQADNKELQRTKRQSDVGKEVVAQGLHEEQ